jgi:hypothetical protein
LQDIDRTGGVGAQRFDELVEDGQRLPGRCPVEMDGAAHSGDFRAAGAGCRGRRARSAIFPVDTFKNNARHAVEHPAHHAVARGGLALLAGQFAVAVGQPAQGFIVDAELREGGRNFLVAPVEIGLAGGQRAGFLAQGQSDVGFLGREKDAAEQGNQAGGDQAAADLRQAVMVAMRFTGELLAGRRGRQQVQEEQVAAIVFGQRVQLDLAGRGVAVDQHETELAALAAGFLDGRNGQRMGDDENGQTFVTADQALADQVLVELAGFRCEGAGDAGDAAVGERRHAREMGMAVDQITLANRMVLQGEEQTAAAVLAKFLEQQAAQLGNGIDAGQRHFGLGDLAQPGLEMGRVGQGRKEQFFVLALAFLITERNGRGEWRAEKMLADLAGDQRLAVAALQEGNGFQRMAFLGDIGEQREIAAAVIAQVFGKLLQAVVVVVEDALGPQAALLPGIGRQTMGVEIEQAATGHILILLMTS